MTPRIRTEDKDCPSPRLQVTKDEMVAQVVRIQVLPADSLARQVSFSDTVTSLVGPDWRRGWLST
jgi:hypothetical protein